MALDQFPSAVELPKFVRDHSVVLIEKPLRILLIIAICLVIRAFFYRAINGLVRPMETGEVPRLLGTMTRRARERGIAGPEVLRSERRAQRAAALGGVLRSLVSFVVFVIGFLLVLAELGINLAPFLAGTTIIGLTIGFGAQNIIKDFLSGMFMIFEDQYGPGDVIDFEKATGTVEAVGLRTTRLRDVNGTVWYVRNGEVMRVGNKSQGYAAVVLDVPIKTGESLEAASDAMAKVAREMFAEEPWSEIFLAEPEVQGVESLTVEETVIRLVGRVKPLEQWRAARELRRRIRQQFDRQGIAAGVPKEIIDNPGTPSGESG